MIKSILTTTLFGVAGLIILFANLRQIRSQNREIGTLIQKNVDLSREKLDLEKAAEHRFDTQVAENKAELDDWKRYGGYLSSWYDRAVLHIRDPDQAIYYGMRKPTPPAPRQPIITVTNVQIYICYPNE